ncbi:hypothetical protein JD844_014511 [Phrynosoma platyrhinos]|uniref:Cilia- and flagella-associated protein 161 n=1 Tax=Phrynosoma platyrhinos TaxID=52577 RepID=A0ABQ7SRT5_PHRPL|nr:hypothetical protein JD844_014511 [Phrynosoma platyrhinos]
MFNVRTSMSGRIYSQGVLMGNWHEDVCLEEEQLSITKDGFIHFGDTVLLVNPDNGKSSAEKEPGMSGDLSLAVNPDEADVHRFQELVAPCETSAIKCVSPVGRNAFRILSTEGEAMGEPLRYGQNFGLGTTGGLSGRMLFLASDHKTFANMAKKSFHQSAIMTDELTYLASWQATFLDPQLRLENEGFPVPANTKILIVHSHTNQALAVPRNFWIRTYFGKEYEVNCHTYLDSHKAEEDKNYWVIVTGNPSNDANTMFDRPKPPSEETRIQNIELHEET